MPLEFSHDAIVITTPLVTLSEAKEHLRIRDTLHDADVTAKTATAQAAILANLANAADATWTDVTVPLPIKHAILLLTTHYYEHRGDAMPEVDAALWEAIARLLAWYRDPTLA
jgi:Phage gp6-like head-tail connector protein